MVAAGDREIVEVVVLTEGRRALLPLRPVPPAARRVRAARTCPSTSPARRACGSRRRSASSCRSPSVPRPSARAGPTARLGAEAPGGRHPGLAAPSELIRHKRDGGVLSAEELGALVAGITDGSVSDAQVAAFAMAVYFRGMTWEECAALTRAMARSGTRPRLVRGRPRGPDPRQALDRRRRRHGQPHPGAAGRGVRRRRADDLGPRARSHRRHARQARQHPGLRRRRPTSPASGPPCARPAARSSARPRSWRRPTGGSTRSATSRPPSTRSRSSRRRSSRRSWRPGSTPWSWT